MRTLMSMNIRRLVQLFILATGSALTLSGVTLGAETFDILVRNENGKARVIRMAIPELLSSGRFETPDFRIVEKKDDVAISTSERSFEMRLRAATALYHLQKAKLYFRDRLRSSEVEQLEQVTVRLEITNLFSELGHFMHDNREPQYNNALSVPGGQGIRDTKPWQREIWFRPRQEIPIQEVLAKLPEDPFNPVIREVNAALLPSQMDVGIRNVLMRLFSPGMAQSSLVNTLGRQAGTLLLIQGALEVSKQVNRAVLPRSYFVDTAVVPEIAYHEFTHIALSDHLQVTHSTPVIEGIAEYFAAEISGDAKLYRKIRKFSTALPRNGRKVKDYNQSFERLSNAHADFTLAMLWGLRDVFGSAKATELIFESRKHLNTLTSDIRGGLVSALVKACADRCENPDSDRLKLHRYFDSVGL